MHRGGGAVCFGSKAVDNFLAANDFSYIVRAHEAHAEGVGLCKGARVSTNISGFYFINFKEKIADLFMHT